MSAPLAYLGVIAIWATTPLAIKFSNHSLSPIGAVTARMLLATLLACVLVALLFHRSGLKWGNWKVYLAASISLFPNMPLVYLAAEYIPSGLISALFALAPFMMGLLSVLLLGNNPFTPLKLLGLTVALVGLLLVSLDQLRAEGAAWMGIVLMLGSTLLFSLSNVLVKKLNRGIDSFEQALGAMLFSLPGLLTSWYLFDGELPAAVDATSAWAVAYLAVVGSLLGFFAFYYVLGAFSVQTVGLVPMITPALALWLGAQLAGESLGAPALLGTALIVCGLLVHELWAPAKLDAGRETGDAG